MIVLDGERQMGGGYPDLGLVITDSDESELSGAGDKCDCITYEHSFLNPISIQEEDSGGSDPHFSHKEQSGFDVLRSFIICSVREG